MFKNAKHASRRTDTHGAEHEKCIYDDGDGDRLKWPTLSVYKFAESIEIVYSLGIPCFPAPPEQPKPNTHNENRSVAVNIRHPREMQLISWLHELNAFVFGILLLFDASEILALEKCLNGSLV